MGTPVHPFPRRTTQLPTLCRNWSTGSFLSEVGMSSRHLLQTPENLLLSVCVAVGGPLRGLPQQWQLVLPRPNRPGETATVAPHMTSGYMYSSSPGCACSAPSDQRTCAAPARLARRYCPFARSLNCCHLRDLPCAQHGTSHSWPCCQHHPPHPHL